MKIVILSTAHPFRGGIAAFVERLARQFMAEGHEVIIYTWTFQYPKFLFPGEDQYSHDPAPTDLDIRVKVHSMNPFNWWKVGRELRKLAPDLLVFKYWTPFVGPSQGTIARIARKNGKTKALVVVDNWIPHEKKFVDKSFTRYFGRSVDGFLAMSKKVQADIDAAGTGKPTVFSPHPIYDNFGPEYDKSEAKRLLGLKEDTHYVLFFGFIREYKGLDLAIRAMADPVLAGKPIQLIVAGEFYKDPKPYLDLIQELGVGDRIELHTHFIPNDEVGKYFSACDLVVHPYKWGTQSGVAQIAYHYERPMVATEAGGLPEIVPHGKVGYIAEIDAHAIAEAIATFFREDKAAEFRANIQKKKPEFYWGTFTKALLSLLSPAKKAVRP
jgi:D-inositol-3-phosphate glycosyltransferase